MKRLLLLALTGLVLFTAISAVFAWKFTSAMRKPQSENPQIFLGQFETVAFSARDGVPLAGWYVPCPGAKTAVVLLHGHGSNRSQMLARAKFFRAQGFAVLLYDARGHGLSGGDHVSFGWYETRDLLGALDFLRARGFHAFGCLGVSMGGATIALAAAELRDMRWAVLESTFPTLTDAVDCRIRRKIHIPGWLAACLMVPVAEARLGVDIHAISPRDGIARLPCPVLILSGESDEHTPLAHAREVYDRAPSPKSWWSVPGAAHTDLYGFAPPAYEQHLSAFLAEVR